MYIIIFAIIGLFIGKLSGGKFKNFSNLWINKFWLGIPLLTCIPLRLAGFGGLKINSMAVFIVSFMFVTALLYFNRNYIGMHIIGLGFLLNSLVVALNGGKMPVDRELAKSINTQHLYKLVDSGKDIKHVFMNSHTKLSILGDKIYLPKYMAAIIKPDIASIGVMVLMVNFMRCEK